MKRVELFGQSWFRVDNPEYVEIVVEGKVVRAPEGMDLPQVLPEPQGGSGFVCFAKPSSENLIASVDFASVSAPSQRARLQGFGHYDALAGSATNRGDLPRLTDLAESLAWRFRKTVERQRKTQVGELRSWIALRFFPVGEDA